MANVSEINSVAREVFMPRVGMNFGKQSVFLKMARAKGDRKGGGTNIVKSVAYQYTKGKAYGRGDVIDVSGEQNVTSAKLSYRYYDWPGTITRQDQLESSGEGRVHDLLSTKFQVMTQGANEMVSNDIFSTAGEAYPLKVNTLDHAMDDASGTLTDVAGTAVTSYAGIDRTTNSWWAGNVVDVGGASASTTGPSYRAYQKIWAAAHDGDVHPNLVLSHATCFDTFMSQQQPQQQYISATDAELTAGFRRTVFNGVPYVADNHIPVNTSTGYTSNRVYMFNMDYWTFWTHEDEDFRFVDWQKPIDQNTLVCHILWAGNHLNIDPRRHAVGYNFKADYIA